MSLGAAIGNLLGFTIGGEPAARQYAALGQAIGQRVAAVMRIAPDSGGITHSEPNDPCLGCQQAMQRLADGAHRTECHVCGCYWIDQETADSLRVSNPPLL